MTVSLISNIASLMAQNNLARTTESLGKSFERLSSGLRINGASDDAAGLAIAQSTRANRAVFSQAIRNTNDGISLLNIADSSLEQLSSIVTRLRELAEQSANSAFSPSQRKALDAEASQLSKEYFRIGRSSSFNGLNLFDGTLQQLVLQTGYGSSGTINSNLGGNLGTGSVATGTSIGSGTSVSEATADLNGDGNLDLVIGKNNQIDVFLGTGNGSFASSAIALDTGNADGNIALGDFNNDGKVDIAATRLGGGFTIITNNGDGTFQTPQAYVTSVLTVAALNVADFNQDGQADLLVSGSSQQLFLGSGTGTLQGGVNFSSGITNVFDAKVGDVNGDGITDIVLGGGNFGSSSLAILLGSGSGTFGAATVLGAFGLGGIRSIAIGDVNNDGAIDIVSGAASNGVLGIYTGNGAGGFSAGTSYTAPSLSSVGGISLADMNGDGNQDILVNGSTGGSSQLHVYAGDGRGNATLTYSSTGAAGTGRLVTGDFNNDGVMDAIGVTSGASEAVVTLGNTRYGVGPLVPFDLLTRASSLQALSILSRAQDALSIQRGVIGAFQSRTKIATDNLRGFNVELAAAESRITDVDMAQETAEVTRLSILQQAGVAVLSQANIQPQIALKLLE